MGWKNIKKTYVLNTKWLKVRNDTVALPNGVVLDDYLVVEKKNAALIVAMDENQNVILKKEYRYPIDQELIELPGGTFEDGEDDPLTVAKRELLEETGYESSDWELLFTNYEYPTKDTNTVSIFLAKNVRKIAEQKLDISEEITYKFVSLKEAVEMCMNRTICVNGTLAALLKVARLYKC